MIENQNSAIVNKLYEEFGRGNIDGILAMLADDVVWEEPESAVIPYGGSRKGKEAVRQFFAALSQVQVERFEPRQFVASGEWVIALGEWAGRVASTGKRFESAWAMSWRITGGKVVAFRAYEDSEKVAAAFSR